jgi:hypothetical protein
MIYRHLWMDERIPDFQAPFGEDDKISFEWQPVDMF